MRYLGVDYGSKKVGLALSDEAGTMGFPDSIVPTTPRLIETICARIGIENIGAVVIGDSRDLSGAANPIAEEAHAFGTKLSEQAGVPVFYESEVFTSALARRPPEQTDKSRSRIKKDPVDASAAALILTSYLSRIAHG